MASSHFSFLAGSAFLRARRPEASVPQKEFEGVLVKPGRGLFPGHFQAQKAASPSSTDRFRVHKLRRSLSRRFRFTHQRPGFQIRGRLHLMLHVRCIRIDGPRQNQMHFPILSFPCRHAGDASAGPERIKPRSVFHQVDDAVAGGCGLRGRLGSPPCRRGICPVPICHILPFQVLPA